MKRIVIILFALIIAQRIFGQYDSIVTNYFDNIVQYDSVKAISDIKNDSIFILQLSGIGYLGDPGFENNEIEYVEKRFGFRYKYERFEIPMDYLQLKQKEYNRQVFNYLDTSLNLDSRQEIKNELKRLLFERLIIQRQTDKDIEKYINKQFRSEKKSFRTELIKADITYRDRNFELALIEYEELEKIVETEKCKDYISTSKYHCLVNMEEFKKANMLANKNINRVIKQIKNTTPNIL